MKEVILNAKEIKEGVEQAYRTGGIEECQRRGFNVHEVRPAHPNEIVKETIIYDGEEEDKYSRARTLVNALTAFALPLWIDQLRILGVRDSGYYLLVQKERDAKRRRTNN